ncbi:MAG: anthranilate synthase component I family protein [Nannocystaceae bacterium]
MSALASGLLAAAADDLPGFAWLDGGAEGRSFAGVEVDASIEAEDLEALDEVDRAWRAAPERLWIGWVTYDLGASTLLGRRPRPGRLRGLVFRRYRAGVEFDGGALRWHGEAAAIDALRRRVAGRRVEEPGAWPWGALAPVSEPSAHRRRVSAILERIAAGDTYQVNLSQVLRASWRRRPADREALARAVAGAYGRLRAATPASMGGLLAADDAWILSNSPETLFDVRLGRGATGDRMRTWPIKGTRPRGPDPAADRRAAAELLACAKERAEHLMIVDLLRNDLGRLARPGSVVAPRVPTLVSLPTVHHLVSEVACELRPGWTLRSLFTALFPGGSITGAPKRRTVEIIDSLEDHRRGIYCGAIVVLEPGGIRASIPIRTAIVDRDGLELCSGGGIVADSDPEAERVETLVKARAFDPR